MERVSARKKMIIHGYTFTHRTWIREAFSFEPARSSQIARPWYSDCVTTRPASRCDCGMYDIEWERPLDVFGEPIA